MKQINPNITINDEQTVDILIEGARKTSNTLMLETAKLIKAALINNQHSEKPVSELDVLHKMVKELWLFMRRRVVKIWHLRRLEE